MAKLQTAQEPCSNAVNGASIDACLMCYWYVQHRSCDCESCSSNSIRHQQSRELHCGGKVVDISADRPILARWHFPSFYVTAIWTARIRRLSRPALSGTSDSYRRRFSLVPSSILPATTIDFSMNPSKPVSYTDTEKCTQTDLLLNHNWPSEKRSLPRERVPRGARALQKVVCFSTCDVTSL